MKILVTGGAGDLGSAITDCLTRYAGEVFSPGRDELNVTSMDCVDKYIGNQVFDVLVNCAGSIHSRRLLESEPNLWIRDINVNLIGTYLVSRKVLMNNPKAKVINISSTAAYNNYPDWSSYCSSKAAVNSFSRSLVNDGFEVYTICPGGIDTKFRNYFNLDNSNLMHLEQVVSIVVDVLFSEKFNPGDEIFIRKNEFKVLRYEHD